MTHPEELLAGYTDGTLTHSERVVVEEHLHTCETCREELKLAARARAALASLTEESVPFGVMNPVTEEARRRTERRRPWTVRLQWVAGLAAAAALVAVVALNLPRVGGEGSGGAAFEAASPAAPDRVPSAGALAPALESQDTDYDASELEALANEVAGQAKSAEASRPAPAAVNESVPAVVDCLMKGSSITENDQLVRLIEARFQGIPAYLGVFLESPGAGQSPTRVVIWVVAKKGCQLLSYSSKPLR